MLPTLLASGFSLGSALGFATELLCCLKIWKYIHRNIKKTLQMFAKAVAFLNYFLMWNKFERVPREILVLFRRSQSSATSQVPFSSSF